MVQGQHGVLRHIPAYNSSIHTQDNTFAPAGYRARPPNNVTAEHQRDRTCWSVQTALQTWLASLLKTAQRNREEHVSNDIVATQPLMAQENKSAPGFCSGRCCSWRPLGGRERATRMPQAGHNKESYNHKAAPAAMAHVQNLQGGQAAKRCGDVPTQEIVGHVSVAHKRRHTSSQTHTKPVTRGCPAHAAAGHSQRGEKWQVEPEIRWQRPTQMVGREVQAGDVQLSVALHAGHAGPVIVARVSHRICWPSASRPLRALGCPVPGGRQGGGGKGGPSVMPHVGGRCAGRRAGVRAHRFTRDIFSNVGVLYVAAVTKTTWARRAAQRTARFIL